MNIISKALILIPCSGSKKSGGITEYNSNNSILNYLTDASKEHLLSLRRRLFEYGSVRKIYWNVFPNISSNFFWFLGEIKKKSKLRFSHRLGVIWIGKI